MNDLFYVRIKLNAIGKATLSSITVSGTTESEARRFEKLYKTFSCSND